MNCGNIDNKEGKGFHYLLDWSPSVKIIWNIYTKLDLYEQFDYKS